eukprot:234647-Chlamydomonas_euryale.AAC.1
MQAFSKCARIHTASTADETACKYFLSARGYTRQGQRCKGGRPACGRLAANHRAFLILLKATNHRGLSELVQGPKELWFLSLFQATRAQHHGSRHGHVSRSPCRTFPLVTRKHSPSVMALGFFTRGYVHRVWGHLPMPADAFRQLLFWCGVWGWGVARAAQWPMVGGRRA